MMSQKCWDVIDRPSVVSIQVIMRSVKEYPIDSSSGISNASTASRRSTTS